jgi:phage shock protein PspC (stress-responsive transcriptional regulator)
MVPQRGLTEDGVDRSERQARPEPESTPVNETSPGGAPTGSPPSASSTSVRPPLRRPREGRLIAGVAAGVAEHVGMDVAIVRILFVVATVFTSGLGVAAYALAWIFIPEQAADDPTALPAPANRELAGRDPLFWVGIGLLVLGAVALLGRPGFSPFLPWLRPDRGVLIPLVVIAFGIALWRAGEGRQRPTSPPAPPVPPSPHQPTSAWQPVGSSSPYRSSEETAVNDETTRPPDPEADRDTTVLPRPADPNVPPPGFSPPPGGTPPGGTAHGGPPSGAVPPTPVAQGPAWSPPPVPPRESAVLVRSTLGLALVTAGVLWLLRVADVITLGTGRIVSAALLVIGIGLLVGTFVGRGRGLIGAGVVLLPIVVIAELLYPMNFELADYRQGVGEHVAVPTTLDDLEASYQLGAGTLTVDLRELELTGDRRVSVQVGFGEAVVLVPDDVTVEVTAQVAGGELVLFDRTSSGLALDRTVIDEVDDEVGRLELDVQVGFGEANVRRVPAATTDN